MRIIAIPLLIVFSVSAIIAQDNKAVILQDLEKNQSQQQEIRQTATLKMASRLFGQKDDLTTVILIIPSGSVVDVLESDSTYLKVVYEDYEGYIFKRQTEITEAPAETKTVTIPEQVQENPVEKKQEPAPQKSRFSYLEDKYGSSMAAKIMSGKIWKGMDAEMVSDSWGSPKKINRVIAGNTVKEEWIYKSTWLYIENDRLVEWGPIR